jgi:hypothetical protein
MWKGDPLLPDFLIIGAMKAGTSALHKYLAQHDATRAPGTKEKHFFDVHYRRGIDWYRSCFDLAQGELPRAEPVGFPLTFESTPYYLFHPQVPRRVAKHLPWVK